MRSILGTSDESSRSMPSTRVTVKLRVTVKVRLRAGVRLIAVTRAERIRGRASGKIPAGGDGDGSLFGDGTRSGVRGESGRLRGESGRLGSGSAAKRCCMPRD